MSAKLAISFITYNRAKHINEDLGKIAEATGKNGIDIYIFDGSTNEDTELVVKKYLDKGYEHIFYFHYEDNIEASCKRVKDAYLLPDAEYIWFCGDKFVILPQNYEEILKYIDLSYDAITIYGNPIKATKRFTDPVKYVDYSIIPLTHFGSTIIKKDLISKYDLISMQKKFPGYMEMVLYINVIQKKDFKGITIYRAKNQLCIRSRYNTKSYSQDYMWDIWVKDWYFTIMRLPKRYNTIKANILCRPDKDMKFFDLKSLLWQRSEGQFDFKKCIEYKKYFPKVILLPSIGVYCIALLPKKMAKVILDSFF